MSSIIYILYSLCYIIGVGTYKGKETPAGATEDGEFEVAY